MVTVGGVHKVCMQNLSIFWGPPCSKCPLIYAIKFLQPPWLHQLLHDPPSPSDAYIGTYLMEAPLLQLHAASPPHRPDRVAIRKIRPNGYLSFTRRTVLQKNVPPFASSCFSVTACLCRPVCLASVEPVQWACRERQQRIKRGLVRHMWSHLSTLPSTSLLLPLHTALPSHPNQWGRRYIGHLEMSKEREESPMEFR